MKKIIVIMNWLRKGGAERNTIKIANYLSKNNHVTLVVMSREYEDLKDYIRVDINIVYCESVFKLFCFYFKSICKADIAFAGDHRIATYLLAFNSLSPFKKPEFWCRSINNLSQLLYQKSDLFKYIIKKIMSHQDLVIAQCSAMKKDLVNNWGVRNERCLIIYNPMNQNNQSTPVIDSNNYEEFNFLYVGRFSKQKRIPLMVESFAKAKLGKNTFLNLVGYRNWMESDKEVLEEINIISDLYSVSDRVKIFPWTSNSQPFFESASCFLLTSAFEGFPNVLVESISYGVPIVSVNCDFGPEEIVDDNNGFLVNSSSAEEISKFIKLAFVKNWSRTDIQQTSLKFSEDNQFCKFDEKII